MVENNLNIRSKKNIIKRLKELAEDYEHWENYVLSPEYSEGYLMGWVLGFENAEDFIAWLKEE